MSNNISSCAFTLMCIFFCWLLWLPMPDSLFESLVDKKTHHHNFHFSCNDAHFPSFLWRAKMHTRTIISTYIVQCFHFNLFVFLVFVRILTVFKWTVEFFSLPRKYIKLSKKIRCHHCRFKWKSVDNNVTTEPNQAKQTSWASVTTFRLGDESESKKKWTIETYPLFTFGNIYCNCNT